MNLMPLGNANGPWQPDMESVPRVRHDIRSGIKGFGEVVRTLQHRDRAIGIFTVNNLSVMPHLNSRTRKSSGHIVRIFDSTPPAHVDYRYNLDLYILDVDLYITAFRRRRISVQEEEAGVAEDVGCGQWFCFQDKVDEVPDFLEAVPIYMTSEHGNACPGGEYVLEDMLYSLANFETEDGKAGDLTMQVTKALWNAMVIYCETRRLRSILIEMYRRIRLNMPSHSLSKAHWLLIHRWTNFCSFVLSHRKQGTLSLETPLPSWVTDHHPWERMESLIGIYGELLMIKLDLRELDESKEIFEQRWKAPGAWNVAEPGIRLQF